MSGEDDRKFYEICINSIETEVSKIESTEESLTETNRGQVLDLCEKCAKNIHFVLENWLSKENREKYLAENPEVRKVLGKYYNLAVYSINSEMTQISIAERRLNYSNFIQIADLCEASATRVTPVELLLAGPQGLHSLVGDPPMKHPVQLALVDDQC